MTPVTHPHQLWRVIAAPELTPMAAPRLLAGTPLEDGAETYWQHVARLGRRPAGSAALIDEIERSGLRGRGGAWFPTARKWRAVANAARDQRPVVVANASEGEPLAAKDRTLLEHRPHLVIDGALTAAESIGAGEVVIYVSRAARPAQHAVRHALRERHRAGCRELPVRVVETPDRYIAGESSAVVRRVNGGPAKPDFSPPHPSERGVDGRPTLVQNAETLAHVALIARNGHAWFRERGEASAPGTVLVTIAGNVRYAGVYEVNVGTPMPAVLLGAGGAIAQPGAALVGGYFGSWIDAGRLATMRLIPDEVGVGCGVIGVLGADACGLCEAATIVEYLAQESAEQCGPCVYGLHAIAGTMRRIAEARADRSDLARLERWMTMVEGRGACRHPDGAINNVITALDVFADDLSLHVSGHACGRNRPWLPEPKPHRGWR